MIDEYAREFNAENLNTLKLQMIERINAFKGGDEDSIALLVKPEKGEETLDASGLPSGILTALTEALIRLCLACNLSKTDCIAVFSESASMCYENTGVK